MSLMFRPSFSTSFIVSKVGLHQSFTSKVTSIVEALGLPSYLIPRTLTPTLFPFASCNILCAFSTHSSQIKTLSFSGLTPSNSSVISAPQKSQTSTTFFFIAIHSFLVTKKHRFLDAHALSQIFSSLTSSSLGSPLSL